MADTPSLVDTGQTCLRHTIFASSADFAGVDDDGLPVKGVAYEITPEQLSAGVVGTADLLNATHAVVRTGKQEGVYGIHVSGVTGIKTQSSIVPAIRAHTRSDKEGMYPPFDVHHVVANGDAASELTFHRESLDDSVIDKLVGKALVPPVPDISTGDAVTPAYGTSFVPIAEDPRYMVSDGTHANTDVDGMRTLAARNNDDIREKFSFNGVHPESNKNSYTVDAETHAKLCDAHAMHSHLATMAPITPMARSPLTFTVHACGPLPKTPETIPIHVTIHREPYDQACQTE